MQPKIKSSHRKNTQYSAISILVSACIAFFLSPYVLIQLGPIRFGIWAVINSLIGVYGFMDVGVRAAFEHRLTRAVYRNNPKYVNHVFSTGQHLTRLFSVSTICISIVSAAVLWFSDLVPSEIRAEVSVCALMYGTLVAVKFWYFSYSALISALRRFDLRSQLRIATSIAVGLSTAVAVYLSPNLGLMSIAASAPVMLSLIATKHFAWQLYPGLVAETPSRQVRRLLLRTGFLRVVSGLSSVISRQIDSVTIALTCGVPLVAGYSIAASVSSHLLKGTRIFAPTIFGHASQAFAERRTGELEKVLVFGTRYCCLFAIPLVAISVLYSYAFFDLWLAGSDVVDSQRPDVTYSILAFSTLTIFASVPATQVLLASEMTRLVAIITIVEAVVNLLLSVTMGLVFGPIGVASATLVASVIVAFPAKLVAASRPMEMRIAKVLAGGFARPLFCLLLFAPSAIVIESYLHPDSWFSMALGGACCFAAWLFIAFFFGLVSTERNSVVKKVGELAAAWKLRFVGEVESP